VGLAYPATSLDALMILQVAADNIELCEN